MMFCKCDNCGKTQVARPHKEGVLKPMWCEPKDWLRRFDKDGGVIGLACCYACDKEMEKGLKRKPGTEAGKV